MLCRCPHPAPRSSARPLRSKPPPSVGFTHTSLTPLPLLRLSNKCSATLQEGSLTATGQDPSPSLVDERAVHGGQGGQVVRPTKAGPATVQELTLEIGVSRQVAFRLQQQFGHQGVQEVKQSCLALQKVLKINIEEAGLLASKEPRLLSNLSAVGCTFEALKTILGDVTYTEASRIAVYAPTLLTVPHEDLQRNFELILTRLGIPQQQLSDLIFKQPNVIVTNVDRLEQRLTAVMNLLEPLSMQEAVALLCSFPRLMVEDIGDLSNKMESLKALLEANNSQVVAMVLRYPPLLVTNSEVTAARIERMAELLSVDRSSICCLVLSCPNVLSIASNLLCENFEKVFSLLPQDRDSVVRTVARNPALLPGLVDFP